MATKRADFVNGTRLIYPMEVQAMRRLNLIGNLIFGWIFLREMPTDLALIGGIIAVVGAYFITKNIRHKG